MGMNFTKMRKVYLKNILIYKNLSPFCKMCYGQKFIAPYLNPIFMLRFYHSRCAFGQFVFKSIEGVRFRFLLGLVTPECRGIQISIHNFFIKNLIEEGLQNLLLFYYNLLPPPCFPVIVLEEFKVICIVLDETVMICYTFFL
jgi:hypothetical protein